MATPTKFSVKKASDDAMPSRYESSGEVAKIRKAGEALARDPKRARRWLVEGGFIRASGGLTEAYRSK